eukprot:COSAG05_NODE_1419_length_4930_cov_4.794866_2_plen_128_part_00
MFDSLLCRQDIYFLVDIYLSCLMCFYDVNGRLITSRRVIAAKYLKGWFLIDVLSCLPVGYIGYFANDILGAREDDTLPPSLLVLCSLLFHIIDGVRRRRQSCRRFGRADHAEHSGNGLVGSGGERDR